MIEIFNKNNNKSSELEYEYIKSLEDDVAKRSREYIFMMAYDQLKNVTELLMAIGVFYSEHNERKQARDNYIKALDYCEYAVAEDENDEILT